MTASDFVRLDELVAEIDPARNAPAPSGRSAQARWTWTKVAGGTQPITLGRTQRRLVRRWARSLGTQRRRIFPVSALPTARTVVLAPVRVAVVTAAAAVATVTVLLVSTLLPGRLGGSASAAASVLDEAALAAGAAPLAPGPGRLLDVTTAALYEVNVAQYRIGGGPPITTAVADYTVTDHASIDAAGGGSATMRPSPLTFPTLADELAWEGMGPVGLGIALNGLIPGTAGSTPPVVARLRAVVVSAAGLPTDPARLARVLAAGPTSLDLAGMPSGPGGPGYVFARAARLLVGPTSGMTPARAAALYRVLAALPSITLAGRVVDHAGAAGVGVTLRSPGGTRELVFRPGTGMALEVRAPPSGPPPEDLVPGGRRSGWQLPPACPHHAACHSITPVNSGDLVTTSTTTGLWIDSASRAVAAAPGPDSDPTNPTQRS
ncbi:MAG: hypothetical protein M0020_09270 [Actinomycetota bacterium]|nr:hypothetical protein [Actinomycetota bacterium]